MDPAAAEAGATAAASAPSDEASLDSLDSTTDAADAAAADLREAATDAATGAVDAATRAGLAAGAGASYPPKMLKLLAPPGGACTRVEGRSLRKLSQFMVVATKSSAWFLHREYAQQQRHRVTAPWADGKSRQGQKTEPTVRKGATRRQPARM